MTQVNIKMLKDSNNDVFLPFSTTDAVFEADSNKTLKDILTEQAAEIEDVAGDIPTNVSDLTNDAGYIDKDVNDLTNYTLSTGTGSIIDLSLNSSTYVLTLDLKNSAGTVLSTDTVDLPIESMVVNASYDSTNKKIILTLQSGSTIDVPVGDLVSGLQSEITSSNKLSSDLVDDTNKTNKFVTAADKTAWNAKYDKPGTGIPKTDLADAVQTSLGKADTALQSFTETDPVFSASAAAGITSTDISNWNNKVDKVSGKGLSTNDYTTDEKTKLNGIESGAEVNIIETVKVNGTALTPDANRAVDITVAGDASNISYANTTSGLTADDVQEAIDELASEKVDKVSGKGLSTEDYTTNEKNKLAGIEASADVNTIESISVNSTAVTPDANKNVNITVPTKVSDLNNDSGFITGIDSTDVTTALGFTPMDSALKGANSGVAELDSTGKVPSSQLPSYVDDVIEVDDYSSLPSTGETGKIYITKDTNKTYRWSGSAYVEISESLALGETSSTAYRGDRGKTAYDHSQAAHAPSNAEHNTIETISLNGTALTPDANRNIALTNIATTSDIPTVNNATLTIKKNSSSVGTFTANASSNVDIDITVPTKTSDLTNDSGFITNTDLTTITGYDAAKEQHIINNNSLISWVDRPTHTLTLPTATSVGFIVNELDDNEVYLVNTDGMSLYGYLRYRVDENTVNAYRVPDNFIKAISPHYLKPHSTGCTVYYTGPDNIYYKYSMNYSNGTMTTSEDVWSCGDEFILGVIPAQGGTTSNPITISSTAQSEMYNNKYTGKIIVGRPQLCGFYVNIGGTTYLLNKSTYTMLGTVYINVISDGLWGYNYYFTFTTTKGILVVTFNTGTGVFTDVTVPEEYLSKTNTTAFTPTGDYQPATKKYVDDNSGGGSSDAKDITCILGEPTNWSTQTWSGITTLFGEDIWTDGEYTYYSHGSIQKIFNPDTLTWDNKTWTGLTDFTGDNIFTDGTDIYYAGGLDDSMYYSLNKETSRWTYVSQWENLNIYGGQVWTDGTNTYLSSPEVGNYIFNKNTKEWEQKIWNGDWTITGSLDGNCIWNDGTNIYFSDGSIQAILNIATDTWVSKTWNGYTNINGLYVWTDGTNYYYSYNSTQYVLDKTTSTWKTKTWSGLTSFLGYKIWHMGENTYHSYANADTQYKLDIPTMSVQDALDFILQNMNYAKNLYTNPSDTSDKNIWIATDSQ